MLQRALPFSDETFFLFGPRGTGKTTWLKQHLNDALWFNLLDTHLYLELLRNPARFRQEVLASPDHRWVVVDEIQKIPALLQEPVENSFTGELPLNQKLISFGSAT
jgi:predicted AAA+ superfamily ATPase